MDFINLLIREDADMCLSYVKLGFYGSVSLILSNVVVQNSQ